MNDLSDQRLLFDYARSRSEAAFAQLVQRHLAHVFSAALRIVCDTHLAQDVSQSVFLALAARAPQLTDCSVLSAWLHRTTRNIAAQTVRGEVRRRAREEESAAMEDLLGPEESPIWDEIAPMLDDAVAELAESDREALLLRYFERKSAAQMASALGISPEAAQKRVSRALDRLREYLNRRGITAAATGIATALGSNAVQAVPAGLAAQITGAAAAAGFTAATAFTASKTIAMTAFQKSLVIAAFAASAGTALYQTSQSAKLRARGQALEREAEPLAATISELRGENERLSNQVRQAMSVQSPAPAGAMPDAEMSELLRLRGQATVARGQAGEIARLQDALSRTSVLTNALATGASVAVNFQKKRSAERLARMKEVLNLTDEQLQELGVRSTNRIDRMAELGIQMMTGKATLEDVQAEKARAATDEQADLQTVLTPEQWARMPEFKQAEGVHAARASATADAQQIANQFHLSEEQQNQLETALYESARRDAAQNSTGKNQVGLTFQEGPEKPFEREKEQLAEKVKILEKFLSPDQIASYRTDTLSRIEMQASLLKSVLPPAKSH